MPLEHLEFVLFLLRNATDLDIYIVEADHGMAYEATAVFSGA